MFIAKESSRLFIYIYIKKKKALGSVHDTLIKELSGAITEIPAGIIQSLNTAMRKASDLKSKLRQFSIFHDKREKFQKQVKMYEKNFKEIS